MMETPLLWIIPAWPIASLSVWRLYHLLLHFIQKVPEKWFEWSYWPIFGVFFVLLLDFAAPTFSHPLNNIFYFGLRINNINKQRQTFSKHYFSCWFCCRLFS